MISNHTYQNPTIISTDGRTYQRSDNKINNQSVRAKQTGKMFGSEATAKITTEETINNPTETIFSEEDFYGMGKPQPVN